MYEARDRLVAWIIFFLHSVKLQLKKKITYQLSIYELLSFLPALIIEVIFMFLIPSYSIGYFMLNLNELESFEDYLHVFWRGAFFLVFKTLKIDKLIFFSDLRLLLTRIFVIAVLGGGKSLICRRKFQMKICEMEINQRFYQATNIYQLLYSLFFSPHFLWTFKWFDAEPTKYDRHRKA